MTTPDAVANGVAEAARAWAASGCAKPLFLRKGTDGVVCSTTPSKPRLNQTDFARALGMSINTFRNKVRGHYAPEPAKDGRWDEETVSSVRSALRFQEDKKKATKSK